MDEAVTDVLFAQEPDEEMLRVLAKLDSMRDADHEGLQASLQVCVVHLSRRVPDATVSHQPAT